MRDLLPALLLLALLVPARAVSLHVGPRRELKSLVAARDAARGLAGPCRIEVDPGTYRMTQPLDLTADDSHTTWSGAGRVRLCAGQVLDDWQPVAEPAVLARLPEPARAHVLVADLAAAGLADYGGLQPRGFARPMVPAHLELFYDGAPMTLARYPNAGEFVRVAAVPDGQDGMRLTCDDEHIARWAAEPEPWVFGYWFHDWADIYQPIAAIDAATRTITLGDPKPNYGIRAEQRFHGFNLLCELDAPGEWYLDRETGRLYFWPPAPDGEAVVSVGQTMFRLDGAADLAIEGFTLDSCRGTAIEVSRCERVSVTACTIRNTGNRAISVSGGAGCRVVGCDISDTGEGGISISGGDRKTLTPAGHVATNNAITRYSRWCRTYRPAIGVDGVGQVVEHNLIWDGPHNGILLGGNEHRIAYNELHDVCWETGDVGAFYMGRDWTARGTVIQHNYFHHITGPGTYGANSVYLDDSASGIAILGNVFWAATRAMFIGGGRDNTVDGNVFVDCRPALHIDARAMGWMHAAVEEPNGVLLERLRAMPVTEEPWRTRYPRLLAILDDEPAAPKGNVVRRNVCVGGAWDEIEGKALPYQTIEDNYLKPEATPDDELDAQWQPKAGSPAYETGFRRIPFERIGLRREMPRASWPVEHPLRK